MGGKLNKMGEMRRRAVHTAGKFMDENSFKLATVAFAVQTGQDISSPQATGLEVAFDVGAATSFFIAEHLLRKHTRDMEKASALSDALMEGVQRGVTPLPGHIQEMLQAAGHSDITTMQGVVAVVGPPKDAVVETHRIVKGHRNKKESSQRYADHDAERLAMLSAVRHLPVYAEVFALATRHKRSLREERVERTLARLQQQNK